jgi:hypothetical protein
MYVSPRVTDFGRIELHTYQAPGSPAEPGEGELPGSGGGGIGVGVIGLIGGAAVLAGRGQNEQPAAVLPDEEEKGNK